MANKRVRRNIVRSMEALHKVGAVSTLTLKNCEADLFGPPPTFTSKDIVALRKLLAVSQAVLAIALNVTSSTVQQWEQGKKRPGGAAARLLQVAKEHGLETLMPQ